MDCPRCGLVNPPEASRCDGGYDFVTGRLDQSRLIRTPEDTRAEVHVGVSSRNIFSIGSIILWGLGLSFLWPRITGQNAFSIGMLLVGALLAPVWAGVGTHIGEQIEKRYRTERASKSPAESVSARVAGSEDG